MTARDYSEITFECGRRGAKAYIKKDARTFNFDLVSSLNRNVLPNLFCPAYTTDGDGLLHKSVDGLIQCNPEQVSEWARELKVSESRLWNEWQKKTGMNPKHALCVFHVFSELFGKIDDACRNEAAFAQFTQKECGQILLGSAGYKKCLEYYFLNKKDIEPFVTGR
jgi:hypothetical protein